MVYLSVKALRHQFPKIRKPLRTDSSIFREEVMEWFEKNALLYVYWFTCCNLLPRILREAISTAKSAWKFIQFDTKWMSKNFHYCTKIGWKSNR